MSAIVDFTTAKVAVIRPQVNDLIGIKPKIKVHQRSLPISAFISLVIAMIAVSMVGVIFLQALIAKSAFQKVELVQQRTYLVAERAYLMERAAELESPKILLERARAIGMISPNRPTYLRLSDHKLLDGRRN